MPKLISLLAFAALLGADSDPAHLQVDGEWSFIKLAHSKAHPQEAVILIHGNGQVVTETSSTWERDPAMVKFMQNLQDAGYLLAQTNHGATPQNGMWGNAKTQQSVLALQYYLRKHHSITRFHAIGVSAGNITLLNLLLDRKTQFETGTLVVPVISLASLYKCPAKIDRVTGIAQAFGFTPSGPCPGNPEKDTVFQHAVRDFDPLAKIRTSPAAAKSALAQTRWQAVYNTGDPKVPVSENIKPFIEATSAMGIRVKELTTDLADHSPAEPVAKYTQEIVSFLQK